MITNLVDVFKLYNSLFYDHFANFTFSLLRTKNKYRVFGGLWFGEDKHFFSTFFKPFVDTLKKTEVHGELTFCSLVVEHSVFLIK